MTLAVLKVAMSSKDSWLMILIPYGLLVFIIALIILIKSWKEKGGDK